MKYTKKFCFFVILVIVSSLNISAQKIKINTKKIITPDHIGFGGHFYADWWLNANRLLNNNNENTWQYVVEHLKIIRPKIMRMQCNLNMWEFVLGQTTPHSDWLIALERALDIFRELGTEVFLDEWITMQDPAWCDGRFERPVFEQSIDRHAHSLVNFIKHLVWEKGYYNIKGLILWNEVNGEWKNKVTWEKYCRAVSRELKSQGLENFIVFTGPGAVQEDRNWPFRETMTYSFTNMDDVFNIFDYHLYLNVLAGYYNVSSEDCLYDNIFYDLCSDIVKEQKEISPSKSRKPILITEGTGIKSHLNGAYYIDTLNSGIAGSCLWYFIENYYIWSGEVHQKGDSILDNKDGKFVALGDGSYEAIVMTDRYSYNYGTVYETKVSDKNIKVACLKDNDSDSWTIYVHNLGENKKVSFSIDNNINRIFKKIVHPDINTQKEITMTNGVMVDEIQGNTFIVYYSEGQKELIPPSAPTNFKVTAVSPRKVRLTWDMATDNVRVARYNLYKNNSKSPIISLKGNLWEDKNVEPGKEYVYEIKSLDGVGNESVGIKASITTPDVKTKPPQAPKNLTVKDNLSEIEIEWEPATDDKQVVGYKVYEKLSGEPKIRTEPEIRVAEITGNPPKCFYVSHYGRMIGRWENVTHSIYVTAIDEEGNESQKSETINVITPYGHTWDFDENYDLMADGLQGHGTIGGSFGDVFYGNSENGIYILKFNSKDRGFNTATFGFTADKIQKLHIILKNETNRDKLRIGWIKEGDRTYNENKSITIPITTQDKDFKEYTVDLMKNSTWSGLVYNIYFEFIGTSEGNIYLKYIRVGTF